MENISIFNYEAYYLDFLEGNLSDEDMALLLAFLEKNPELKLEDDFLPELNRESAELPVSFKAGLKQIDLASDIIAVENVEQFIIAETEGLLNASRKKELEAFIGQNGSLQKLRAQYAATRLKPDLRITFPDKKKLKKGRTILLWPAVSLAAAASVAAFFFLFNSPNEPAKKGNNNPIGGLADSLRSQRENEKSAAKFTDEPNDAIPTRPVHHDRKTNEPINHPGTIPTIPQANATQSGHKEASADEVTAQQHRANQLVNANQELIVPEYVVERSAPAMTVQGQTALGFEDMKNPIKPITNRLGNLINKEVDFRTARSDEKNSGGFLLKIGNFELSHKEH
jgi:hypothetical protein